MRVIIENNGGKYYVGTDSEESNEQDNTNQSDQIDLMNNEEAGESNMQPVESIDQALEMARSILSQGQQPDMNAMRNEEAGKVWDQNVKPAGY